MTRVRAVAVVLIICCLLAIPVAGGLSVGGSHTEVPTDVRTLNRSNTSAILRLPTTDRFAIEEPALNLSAALSVSWDKGRARIEEGALEQRWQSASEPEERQALLSSALDRVTDRLDGLLQSEQAARQAYLDNEISAEAYLNRLGSLQARAESVATLVSTIDRLVSTDPIDDRQAITRRVLRAESRLAVLTGPLREELAATVRGIRTSSWVYVGASEAGVTLSAIRDGELVHEAARLDNFADEPSGESTGAEEALARWAEIYPSVWDPGVVDFTGLNGAYRASLPYDGGRLESYLDANRLEVYREIQFKDLPGVPTVHAGTERLNGLQLTVNRTYAGGPLKVSFGEIDGTPLDGIVRLNGIRVGTTGADGTSWVIAPDGQFTVTVDYGDRQLTLVVEQFETQ